VTDPGRRTTLLAGLVVAALCLGCGQKGPPLAPFVLIPAPVSDVALRRLGDEVFVGFTLPERNQDGTEPADLVRVDVYAMTVQPRLLPDRTLDLEEFEEAATLVASIEVSDPQAPPPAAPVDGAQTAPLDLRPAQGFPVSLSETLTAATLVPVDPWAEEREEEDDDEEAPDEPFIVPLMTPPAPGPLQRRYAIVGVSSRGEEAEAPERVVVSLVGAPMAPPAPTVTYTEEVANVTWGLPVGVRRAVQAPVLTGTVATGATPAPAGPATPPTPGTVTPPTPGTATPPTPGTAAPPPPGTAAPPPPGTATPPPPGTATPPPPGTATPPPPGTATPPTPGTAAPPAPGTATPPTGTAAIVPAPPILQSLPIVEWPPASRYDLIEIVEPEDGLPTMPTPLNMVPLETPVYADRRVEFGVERCYGVVTLDVVGGLDVRSGLSEPTCVTFIDTFAPAAPEGLTAVGSDGVVSLIWRPNDEEDLAGYLVLRALAPGETLQPLTTVPVIETTYRDTTAEPGLRYRYVVRAVDTAPLPNIGLPSNQVEEGAR